MNFMRQLRKGMMMSLYELCIVTLELKTKQKSVLTHEE